MSESNICRLCVDVCQKYKSLYDKNGRGNQLYEMVYKYLHPTILNLDQAKHLTVICEQCWHHIRDFHNFKLSVLVAQAILNEEENPEVVCKAESDEFPSDSEQISSIKTEEFLDLSDQTAQEEDLRNNDDIVIKAELYTWSELEMSQAHEYNTQALGKHAGELKKPVPLPSVVKKESEFLSPTEIELNDVRYEKQNNLYAIATNEKDVRGQGNIQLITATVEEDNEKMLLSELSNDEAVNKETLIPVTLSEDSAKEFGMEYTLHTDERQNEKTSQSAEHDSLEEDFNCIEPSQLNQLLAEWIPNLKCIACSEPFTDFSLLEDHFRLKHPQEQFYILCCNHKLTNRTSIEEHLLLHSDPHYFKCKLCYCILKSRSNLQRHITTKHPQTQNFKYKCRICEIGVDTEAELLLHHGKAHDPDFKPERLVNTLAGRPGYSCSECGIVFYSVAYYCAHRWRNHRRGPYQCPTCRAIFKCTRTLDEHVAAHRKKNPYSCAYCLMTFRRFVDIGRHRHTVHPHESIRNSYKIIGAKAKRTYNRKTKPNAKSNRKRKALKQISISKEFDELIAKSIASLKCVDCTESFPKLSLLQQHFRQQHANKSFYFICCARKLYTVTLIKEHLQLHQDRDVFKCQLCDHSYTMSRCLKKHIDREHPELGGPHAINNRKGFYICGFCPMTFQYFPPVIEHRKRMHPNENLKNIFNKIVGETKNVTGEERDVNVNVSQDAERLSAPLKDNNVSARHHHVIL